MKDSDCKCQVGEKGSGCPAQGAWIKQNEIYKFKFLQQNKFNCLIKLLIRYNMHKYWEFKNP